MKQFLTLCMATAMIGAGVNANAAITLERAKELKAEGKMMTLPKMTRSSKAVKSLKNLQHAPVSQFHQLAAQKSEMAAKKAPSKVTDKGDNIFGYAMYTDDTDECPLGLYEFESTGTSLVWAADMQPSALALDGEVLKGYSMITFWGFILGIDYVEFDFTTGEIVNLESQDLESNTDYMQVATFNTDTNEFYGFGAVGNSLAFVKAPADAPFNYELISEIDDDEFCLSLCYNAELKALVGVNSNYDLVQIDETGAQTVLSHLDVPDGASYITGIVYDPVSKVYYWNINDTSDVSYMATIDGSSYELDIYDQLTYGEEFVSLFTTDEGAPNPNKPAGATVIDSEFYKSSLIGFVNFQMPSTLADGTAVETLYYNTYVDGELYSTGSAAAGSVVKANFAVPQGMHNFALQVVNKYVDEETGITLEATSGKASLKKYVGYDNPVAPTNVKLTATEVTWDAITFEAVEGQPLGTGCGVHAGYVNPKAVYYVAKVNGVLVGQTEPGSAVTSFDVTSVVDPNEELTVYQAEVIAVANDMESAAATSNTMVEGKALQLPVHITPTATEYEICTILDNNGDGKGWSFNSADEMFQTVYSARDVVNDDWIFLPQVVLDSPEKFYSFSFEAQARSASYPNEYLEVLLCNEPSPRGVVATIIDEFMPTSKMETYDALFRVRQPGTYYVAIHNTSDPDQMGVYVKNINIEDNNVTLASPNVVEDLTAVAGANAALNATVSFTMPTTTFGEQDLAADTQLTATIYVNGEEAGQVSAAPGAEVSKVVPTVQNTNAIKVAASIGELNGPSVETSVYTGVNVPSTIASLASEEAADMLSMTLTWPAVTTGWISEEDPTGGIVDPATVVYDIYRIEQTIFGGQWMLYEQGITETTYTYTVDEGSEQDMVQLGVVARNAAGDNGFLLSAMGILGTPYDLPMAEDFGSDGEAVLNYQPWITYRGLGTTQWSLADNDTNFENGVEGGISMACQGLAGSTGMLGAPRFSTVGASAVDFKITVNDCFYLPVVTILATKAGQEDAEPIGEIVLEDPDHTYGLHTFTFSLPEEYLGQNWVGLFIECEFNDDTEILVIEDLSVEAGSGVNAVALGDVKIAGGKGSIKVSGLNGQDVVVSTLDGRTAAKAAKVSKEATFNLEKGIYVVKAGDKKAKVVVK